MLKVGVIGAFLGLPHSIRSPSLGPCTMALFPFNASQLYRPSAALSLGFAAWITSLATPAIGATPLPPSTLDLTANTTVEMPAEPVLVAELYDLCEAEESTYLVAETENFWVSICGGDAPYTYVGMDKVTEDWIELDLADYAADGSWFEAVNGDYTYSIIFGTAKGSFLTVTEGDETILQEYLLDWE